MLPVAEFTALSGGVLILTSGYYMALSKGFENDRSESRREVRRGQRIAARWGLWVGAALLLVAPVLFIMSL